MATIVTRAGKGAPLTHVEVDANFTNLNTDKIQSGDSVASLDINGGTIDGTVIGGSTPAAISGTTGQFGTSLNVDGTVTADGLTVDGSGTSTFSGGQYLQVDGDAAGFTDAEPVLWARSKVGASIMQINVEGDQWTFGNGGTLDTTPAMRIDGGSHDISFYEDTGTTPKFFWDASAERLGIGTTSPSQALDVVGNIEVSGGVYLGGTTSANLLDDYEEGTFTPTTDGDATGVLVAAEGYYTKVGRLVTVEIVAQVGTNFTSNSIGGLPFTVENLSTATAVGQNTVALTSSTPSEPVFVAASEVTTKVLLYVGSAASNHTPNTTQDIYRIMLSYMTA